MNGLSMISTSKNIVIAGEAGQGIVTIGDLLSNLLVRLGYSIVVDQSYQSRIRGGHNSFSIRVSSEPITAPCETIDLLVALNAESCSMHNRDMAANASIISDDAFGDACGGVLRVPYKKLASGRFVNTAALAVAAAVLGLPRDAVNDIVAEQFEKKPDLATQNAVALKNAFAWFDENHSAMHVLPPARDKGKKIILNGNEAIGLGAISAGLKFLSFYPMTPATSIALTVIKHAEQTGVVVEQAEDEIAAVNMAIGAAFAGGTSMVSTSGGGFALMVEGISLAAMTEVPLVCVVSQRPGPATGLPTRTEQADLMFVLFSGHGEFPRAVFSPGSIEDCFHLTRQAFDVANASQGPVFLLTDQFLADSYRDVVPFSGKDLIPVDARVLSDAGPNYLRYKLTPDGISPRALPGMGDSLVVSDSDEHTEDGHLTEDLSVRKLMVEKRLKKMDVIKSMYQPPRLIGGNSAEILFVVWGSTLGSALEAARALTAQGKKTSVLYFPQVWPIVPQSFEGHLKAAKRLVAIEGNATGQFASLLKMEAGVAFDKLILRYDGLPITPEFILREFSG